MTKYYVYTSVIIELIKLFAYLFKKLSTLFTNLFFVRRLKIIYAEMKASKIKSGPKQLYQKIPPRFFIEIVES